MQNPRGWREVAFGNLSILIWLGLARLILHVLTNGQYGFHRDELATLDYARQLDWGYVDYPPILPLIARFALELFGPSLVGIRFFSALAQSIAIVLTGLMARDLGGSRWAQFFAALCVFAASSSIIIASLFQYVSFDYLWWVLAAYLTTRLCKTADARWWLAIGAAIGLGMLTKYTMAYFAVGIVGGVVFTSARRYLSSPWLWGGVALSLLIVSPNFVWQAQHNFISLDFLSSIHARDVQIGRTDDFLVKQLYEEINPFTLPFVIAGLFFYFRSLRGVHYRMFGWMFAIPFGLFLVSRGRSYYMAAGYPMLLAAGAVMFEEWLHAYSAERVRYFSWSAAIVIVLGGGLIAALALPIAPVGSGWWNIANEANGELREEIGWQDLTETVAGIYAALPAAEQAQTGILAGNYGEAGAINLYGPSHRLPRAISGINTYWLRGYGDPPPRTLIVLGFRLNEAERVFESCQLAGQSTNRYGVRNEETRDHPDIFLCRQMRQPWSEFWKNFRYFG